MCDDKPIPIVDEIPQHEVVDVRNGKSTKCCKISREMIPAKAVYFFEKAKEACHWPYLLLFYSSVGLTHTQSGMINGLRYAGSSIAAPLLGLIADSKHCHKKLVLFTCVISILVNVFQPLVPLVLQNSSAENVTQASDEQTTNVTNTTNDESELNTPNTPNTNLFILMLVVALLGSSFDGSCMTFADYGVIRRISETGTRIGDQRRMGEFGYCAGAMLSSLVLRYIHVPGVSLYAGVFIVYCFVTTALATSFYFLYGSLKFTVSESIKINKSVRENRGRVGKELLVSLKQFKTWFFLITVIVNGIPLAFAYSFTFVFLVELETDPMFFGPLDIINGVSGFIVYSMAERITKGVGGTINGMALSCYFWFIRFVALSYVQNPWPIFPINLTNGICCGLFTYGYMQFIAENFHPVIQTTMCGITNALYFSFSYLLANVVGGGLYAEFGARILFRAQGIICAVWSIVILAYGCLRSRRCIKKREKEGAEELIVSEYECMLANQKEYLDKIMKYGGV